jgi:hypothetical protein
MVTNLLGRGCKDTSGDVVDIDNGSKEDVLPQAKVSIEGNRKADVVEKTILFELSKK